MNKHQFKCHRAKVLQLITQRDCRARADGGTDQGEVYRCMDASNYRRCAILRKLERDGYIILIHSTCLDWFTTGYYLTAKGENFKRSEGIGLPK